MYYNIIIKSKSKSKVKGQDLLVTFLCKQGV